MKWHSDLECLRPPQVAVSVAARAAAFPPEESIVVFCEVCVEPDVSYVKGCFFMTVTHLTSLSSSTQGLRLHFAFENTKVAGLSQTLFNWKHQENQRWGSSDLFFLHLNEQSARRNWGTDLPKVTRPNSASPQWVLGLISRLWGTLNPLHLSSNGYKVGRLFVLPVPWGFYWGTKETEKKEPRQPQSILQIRSKGH